MKVETKFDVGDVVYWVEDTTYTIENCPTCDAEKRVPTGDEIVASGKVVAIMAYAIDSTNSDITYEIAELYDDLEGYVDYAGLEMNEGSLFISEKEVMKQ